MKTRANAPDAEATMPHVHAAGRFAVPHDKKKSQGNDAGAPYLPDRPRFVPQHHENEPLTQETK